MDKLRYTRNKFHCVRFLPFNFLSSWIGINFDSSEIIECTVGVGIEISMAGITSGIVWWPQIWGEPSTF